MFITTNLASLCSRHIALSTVPRRVKNDILRSIDDHKAVALVLLDLSAAFDTVDHTILIQRLEQVFGLDGLVLSWFPILSQ